MEEVLGAHSHLSWPCLGTVTACPSQMELVTTATEKKICLSCVGSLGLMGVKSGQHKGPARNKRGTVTTHL